MLCKCGFVGAIVKRGNLARYSLAFRNKSFLWHPLFSVLSIKSIYFKEESVFLHTITVLVQLSHAGDVNGVECFVSVQQGPQVSC